MAIKARKKRSLLWVLSREDMVKVVASHNSYANVLRHFGLHAGAGNYKTLKRRLEEEVIPYAHLKGRKGGVPKGEGHNVKPLKECLTKDSNVSGGKVKRRLLKEGLFEEACALCGLGPLWNGQKLVLTIDHINGDSRDHRIENLRILCPNCHSQTPTFSGRHQKKRYNCKKCAKVIGRGSTHCMRCAGLGQPTKIEWPPVSELKQRAKTAGYAQVARELGVSDNAIRKRLRNHGDSEGS